MSLEVLQAFGMVTRQGLSGEVRSRRRRFGVPVGGAFDRESLALANALIGNPEDAEAWELGMANVRFRALAAGCVAVVGANVPITVDGHGVPRQAAFPVRPGAEIHIGPPPSGSPRPGPSLSSADSARRISPGSPTVGIGGARVYVASRPGTEARPRRLAEPLASLRPGPLRIVAGPQADIVGLDGILSYRFAVAQASNRVGIRLDGPLHPHAVELPSEPACVGAIQLTNAGQLVILGPDGPTIGGYPKPAVVIDADLDRLAQLHPHDEVTFTLIPLAEALAARQERLDRLSHTLASIRLAAN